VTPTYPWRYHLDARPVAPTERGQDAGERKLAQIRAAIRSAQRAVEMPDFRRCGACDVTWFGSLTCWCCGKPVTENN
jgi:hypothetical protein